MAIPAATVTGKELLMPYMGMAMTWSAASTSELGYAGRFAAENHQALFGQLCVPQVDARVLALEHQHGHVACSRDHGISDSSSGR
jgi:hypothetical protein